MDDPAPTIQEDAEKRKEEEEEEAVNKARAFLAKLGLSGYEIVPSRPPSLPSAASPQSVASSKLHLSIEDIRNSAREFASGGEDLFSKWYFGRESVDKLVVKVDRSRQAQEQERFFLGLVQATMTGKTRLLLEASKRIPLILIRLDNSNVVYASLRHYVELEKAKITATTSFRQWLTYNRRVMLYIRAFFLSHMLYARAYKEAHEKRLFVRGKLAEVEDEICLFNASLLNGGRYYVRALFEGTVERLQHDLTVAHDDDDDLHYKVRDAIQNQHDALSIELDRPTLAIDECHMPSYEASGMLFHSDYKSWRQEDVLKWQRYEFFRDPATRAPRGYPDSYTRGGPTTLFSGFRWVLERYLQRPGEAHQMAIFTSTLFSIWEPLMDKSRFSRGKAPIKRMYLRRMLSCENMLEVIQTIENRSIDGDEREKVSSRVSVWCGRPGFFFGRFLPPFQAKSRDTPLLTRIKKAHQEAESDVVETIFKTALGHLRGKQSIKVDAATVSVTGDEIIHVLCYCHRLRGGNINCLSSTLAELVSAGFAIVKCYDSGLSAKSVGVIAEPLVRNFLDRLANDSGAYAQCDLFLAHEIKRASGTSYGNLAELAIANRIIHACGQPLRELLNAWGLKSTPGDFLDGMTMHATRAAAIDDPVSNDPTDFIRAPLGHVTLPRDGLVMPDISFYASTQSEDYCLVTIQSKATRAKLGSEELDDYSTRFQSKWNDFLSGVRSVYFVRIIICTCGWTGSQRAAISNHNAKNPTQPILLADAVATGAMFGEHCAEALRERVGEPQREKKGKGTANRDWVIPHAWSRTAATKTKRKKRRSRKER